MRPSICPKRRYRSNSLRVSVMGLKLGGMMHSTMKQIAIQNGYAMAILCVSQNFEIFHDRLGPGLRDDDSY